MEPYMWMLLAVLIVIVGLACTIYFSARYFFRLTILRKPTATLENNINANTNWEQHLDFINERKEWLLQQKMEDVFIKSDDNLKLHATLIRNKSNKKCVICFHGEIEGEFDVEIDSEKMSSILFTSAILMRITSFSLRAERKILSFLQTARTFLPMSLKTSTTAGFLQRSLWCIPRTEKSLRKCSRTRILLR